MAIKLKKNGWITLIILAAIIGIFFTFRVNKDKEGSFLGKKKDYLVLDIDTYSPWAGIMKLNDGLEPNEDCMLYKQFGIKLKINITEGNRDGFNAGTTDVTFVTGDTRPIDMSKGSIYADSRVIALANISEGVDAIVVNKTINTVADLRGKRGAYPPGQAGHSFLMEVLETSGLKDHDVKLTKFFKDNDGVEVKVESGIEAAMAMKANQVDFAVVYSPDDVDLASIPGNKILITTKQAPDLIQDYWMATEATIAKKKDQLIKLIEALLWSNAEMMDNDEFLIDAATTFARCTGMPSSYVCELNGNGRIVKSVRDVVRFATLGDNLNFLGLNSTYHGITGEKVYNKMGIKYEQIGLAKQPEKWLKTIDVSIIQAIEASNNLKNDQTAKSAIKYAAPTQTQVASAKQMSSKEVIIEFASGSATLDNNAQYKIDTEFAEIAKNFTNYIRVEGNTDNTGSDAVNKELSRRRAQAAIDYLVTEHGIDRNRFLPAVGNGSKYAIADGSVGSNKQYRNTSFQLIQQ